MAVISWVLVAHGTWTRKNHQMPKLLLQVFTSVSWFTPQFSFSLICLERPNISENFPTQSWTLSVSFCGWASLELHSIIGTDIKHHMITQLLHPNEWWVSTVELADSMLLNPFCLFQVGLIMGYLTLLTAALYLADSVLAFIHYAKAENDKY